MNKLLYFSLSITVVSVALLSMEQPAKRARIKEAMVELVSGDGKKFSLPRDAAELSPTMKLILSGVTHERAEQRIPFEHIDGETLSIVVKILTAMCEEIRKQEAGKLPRNETITYSFVQGEGKYEGYVTQNIQKLVDSIVPTDKIIDVMRVSDFLEMPVLVNAACKPFALGLMQQNPDQTLQEFMAGVQASGIPESSFGYAEKYFLMQEAGVLVPELSIADYVALNGMPAVEINQEGIRVLELYSKGLTSLDGIELLPLAQLVSIDLSENNLFELDPEKFRILATAPQINLSDNNISTLDATIFYEFRRLIKLDLSGNNLTVLDPSLFQDLPNLRELDLSDNHIAVLPSGIFDWLGNLNDLNLFGNELTALPVDLLHALEFLNNFSVGGNQLSVLPPFVFNASTELLSLDLSENQFTEFEPGLFMELISLQMLQVQRNFLPGTEEQFRQQYGLADETEMIFDPQNIQPE